MTEQRIIPYIEMCQREGTSLQRGMNFRLRGRHSVILMSRRSDAHYADHLEEDGSVLVYEGHDASKTKAAPYPKQLDQPEFLPSGRPTENGKFKKAAIDFKRGLKRPDLVRVYEKILPGLWADNGYFHLVDAWEEQGDNRNVFKFKLIAISTGDGDLAAEDNFAPSHEQRRRIIPSAIKQEVWKRDQGKCVTCGSTEELHFDHILPFSKGGTSLSASNVQLLCMRHNLQKSAKIE
jgi:hypothetical protein